MATPVQARLAASLAHRNTADPLHICWASLDQLALVALQLEHLQPVRGPMQVGNNECPPSCTGRISLHRLVLPLPLALVCNFFLAAAALAFSREPSASR